MSWKRYEKYQDSGVEWLGEIPEGWNVTTAKRLFYIVNGSTPKSSEAEYWDGNISWVTPDDLGKLNLDTILETRRTITKEGFRSCNLQLIPQGNLILSTRAPIGHLALTGRSMCTNQGCRGLIFKFNQDCKYFYYLFLNSTSELKSWGQGSTFKELANSKLENIYVLQPPFPEQTAIAAFLDRETVRIDALIEKKERLIALLEEKRAGLISHAVTKGLDPSVPMKDSGVDWIGMVPAGWKIIQLRRVVSKFVDYRGKTPEKVESGRLLITARNIKNGKIDFSLSEEFMKEEDCAAWMVRGFPEIGDVLITTEAPLGEIAQITDTNIALAQRIILLKTNKTIILDDYLKYLLISDSGKGELWSRATGSTAVGIKAEHLRSVIVTVPQLNEQREIVHHIKTEVTKLEKPVNKILKSINILREYRSALISAAVTGKIDLRQEVM